MILCALPYPPIPVQARRFDTDENKLGDVTVITSHDILSNLLEAACVHRDGDADSKRRIRQMEVLRCLMMDLVKDGMLSNEALYQVYCKHTLAHIATYYPVGQAPAVAVLPLSYPCRGDAVHTSACDYMAGQSTVLGMAEGTRASEWTHMQYAALLERSRDRLVSEQEL